MTTPNPESLNNIIAKIKDDVGKIVETVKKLPAEHEQRKHLPNWLQPIHTTFNSIQPVKLTGDGKDLENLNKALGPCLDAAIELTNIVVYEREGKNGKDATAVTKDLLQGTINVAEDPLFESEEIKGLIQQLKDALRQIKDLQAPKTNGHTWINNGSGSQYSNTGGGVQNNNSGPGHQFNGNFNGGYHDHQKPNPS